MKQYFILTLFFAAGLISCSNQNEKTPEKAVVAQEQPKPDSVMNFTTGSKQDTDTVLKNGESIERYKNGVIKMRGIMKNGKRDGTWKSWYEDGTPWRETTFAEGVKNGPTSTWYENGKKRYEGFYTNDVETGKWTYWDEKGNVIAK